MTATAPHPAVANRHFSWRDVRPARRGRDATLPPGQRSIRAFPRFSDDPRRPPPADIGQRTLDLRGAVANPASFTADELPRTRIAQLADFHCVTTWSVRDLRWAGWRFADVWRDVIVPICRPVSEARWIVVVGRDGYRARLHLEDALADRVMLADELEGEPLDGAHGAPWRLVSPAQYGYKSVKHVTAIEVCVDEPPGGLGAKEHLRARVANEERHARWPAWSLRWPYRLLVAPTAFVARRSARPVHDVPGTL